MQNALMALVKEEDGQALTEYGLILGLIAVVCVGMLGLMGDRINGLLDTITGVGKRVKPVWE